MELASRLPLYAPLGMGPLLYQVLLGAATPILFFLGTFINLCWFFTALAVLATLETARALVAIYRLVVKLLPLIGF